MIENQKQDNIEYETLKKELDEIKGELLNIKLNIDKYNKILMKRINKIQEYNELNDMRNQWIHKELKKLNDKIY